MNVCDTPGDGRGIAWRVLPLLVALGLTFSTAAAQAGVYRSDIAEKMPRAEFDARMAQLNKVVDETTSIIKANPTDVDAYYRRAIARKTCDILLIDRPGYRDTIQDLEKCAQLAPENADVQFELGNIYMLNSQPQLAVPHYDAAIKVAPSAKFYRARSAAKEILRYCYAAISDLDEVIKLEPNCAECYYHQGQLYLMDHATQPANEKFKKAAELDPKNSEYVNAATHPVPVYKDPVEQLKVAAIFGVAAILANAALSAGGGSTTAPGSDIDITGNHQTCPRCGGRGSVDVYERSMSGQSMVLTSRPCPRCQGSGYVR